MKTIKSTITALILALFILPGASFAQTIDKKSEDAKKAATEVDAQQKEKQKQIDESTFSTKNKDEAVKKVEHETVKQTKTKTAPPGGVPIESSRHAENKEKEAREAAGTVEKEAEKGPKYHTLKEDQAKEAATSAIPGSNVEKAPPKKETPPDKTMPPAKETPPGKVKEKEDKARGASENAPGQVKEKEKKSRSASEAAPGHVKKADVEKAKKQAHTSVSNTENVVLSTEQKMAVYKEKIENARLRLDENMKAGKITEQEYNEKMIKISQAEEKLVRLQRDLDADKVKIEQSKKVIDKPVTK